MARIPSQKTPFNISDIIAQREFDEQGRETFRAYGSDYSELGGEVFYIGSAPLERFIAFKAFFDSIKFELVKDTEVNSLGTRSWQLLKEKSGKMSIDITLMMPAHSTNEAMNNLAKIEELQRLILPAKWSAEEKENLSWKFEGVSTNTRTTMPLFHAYFKNIINSGRPGSPKIIDKYEYLIAHGFPCYIDSVVYEPDPSVGYFEYDNYLFPKLIKLSLKLNYETESLFDETDPRMNTKPIGPFQLDGHYSQFDSSLFPFGIKMKLRDSGDQSGLGNIIEAELYEPATGLQGKRDFFLDEINNVTNQSSYVFVSMMHNPKTTQPHRYVVFKPFIDSFTRGVKTKIELSDTANSTIHSRVLQNGVTPDATEYSFKINIPAMDLNEAKANCGKIQIMMRMFFKKYSNGRENLEQWAEDREDVNFEDFKQKLLVYIPGMLEMPNTGAKKNDIGDMYLSAVPLYLTDLSFDIDMEAGFFEENNNVYPKVMSLDFKFIHNRADMIRNYNLGTTGQEDYYFNKPKQGSRKPMIKTENAELFPFDRKTSTIGAPK